MKSFLKKTLALACMSLFVSGVLANEPMNGTSNEGMPAKHAKHHHKGKKCHCKCKKMHHKKHHHKKANHKMHEENMEQGQHENTMQ